MPVIARSPSSLACLNAGFLADKPTGYFLPLMLLAGVAALVALLALLFPSDSRPKEHGSDASTPSETI